MKYNTQNAKIASIKEETLVLGIDVGSETHYVRAFDWRNYEFSDKPLAFSNDEAGFLTFMLFFPPVGPVTTGNRRWQGHLLRYPLYTIRNQERFP